MYSNLIKEWSKRYLILEGQYDKTLENPDDYRNDKTFIDSDEYEEWLKLREEEILRLAPKDPKGINEDDEDEEDNEDEEEINLIEKISELKDKLIKTIEKVLSNRDNYSEDEIKDSIVLLMAVDPEKVSEEDKQLLNPETDEQSTDEQDNTSEETEETTEEK